jgi:Transposase DDE domain
MYLRTIQRRNRDGSVVRYVQLAHNERHPVSGNAVARVVHSFGREDQLDRDALARLVASITRYLGPAGQLELELATAGGGDRDLSFVSCRQLGGTWVLDGLWRRLGIDQRIRELLAGRRCDPAVVERVLFALVANRALDPCSKLAATRWVSQVAQVAGLDSLDEDAAYRAMDLLLEIENELAEQVFWATASLLDLEVDLLFFDSTSTYWERDSADPPVARDAHGQVVDPEAEQVARLGGFRTYGHSKDHREDRPQVVIGMAVTRTGVPIRVWTWPGNTADVTVIEQVRAELRDWKLTRVVWVTDRGFASAANRRTLQTGGGHYIQAEKLRQGKEAETALARAGRYRTVAGNLRVKEVKPRAGDSVLTDRFVICHNPEQAQRDATVREQLLSQLQQEIGGTDTLTKTKRAELRGRLSTMPGLNRYLRVTPGGLLRVDADAVRRETRLDGKWLLRTSDPSLSAEDIAAGYKQLLEVERGWRDLKTHLALRPVHHRSEDRIRAHVQLCWLALLLVRVAGTADPTRTWRRIREELQTLQVGTFTGNAGHVHQRTELTPAQRDILTKLDLPEPPRYLHLDPATS